MKSHLLRTSLLAAFLIFCMPLFLQCEAHARKIHPTGTIYPVAEIPDELAEIAYYPPSSYYPSGCKFDKLGYKCHHFEIMYADVFCWGEELVMFKDDPATKDIYKRYGYYYREIPKEIREFLGGKIPVLQS